MKYLNLLLVTLLFSSCRVETPKVEYNNIVKVSSGEDQQYSTLQEIPVAISYTHTFSEENVSPEIIISKNPSNGTLQNCNTTTDFVMTCNYVPNNGFHGDDYFLVSGKDGNFLSSSAAKISVNVKRRGPLLDAINDQIVLQEGSITKIDANDSGDDIDLNSFPITYTCLYNFNSSQGNCSSISGLSFNTSTGVMNWTTVKPQEGLYKFSITASSDQHTDVKNFTINVKKVNNPPLINSVSDFSITSGETINNVDFNDGSDDFDIDGDKLTYSCTINNTLCSAANGVSFDTNAGIFSYNSINQAASIKTVKITSTDGMLSAASTFKINIASNNAPVAGATQTESLLVNTSVNFFVNIASDDQTPASSLEYIIATSPVNGNLTNCFITIGNRACTYTPSSNFIGNDSFKYEVRDQHGAISSVQNVSIIISTDTLQGVESFVQNTASQLKGVDIVWVIDDSGSMGNDQTILANSFSSFIDNFTNQTQITNFNMAVTTTDARMQNENFVKDSNGVQYDLSSAASAADSVKFKEDFKKAVYVGTSGSGSEKAFDSAIFSHSKQASWHRDNDYLLAYIILSDEKEQTSGTTQALADTFKSFKDKGEKVKVFSIVEQGAGLIERFQEVADLTGSKTYDIRSSFNAILTDISTSIVSLLNSFLLKSDRDIIESTVTVKVNSVLVPKLDANGNANWTYNNKSVSFTTPPAEGATIEITYDYKII